MYYLGEELIFPNPEEASPEGIVAVGGDLSVERLLLAYANGIFPWFDDDQPILWWSPDPRMVLFPEKLKISKSMRKILRDEVFTVTFNTSFDAVIRECSSINRKDQDGTWITDQMIQAYNELHTIGRAISVEVWQNSELVGGLYGIDLGNVFCGESMFAKVSNASKAGFIALVQHLQQKKYRLIDCQVYTDHLASLGAEEIDRSTFLSFLDSIH